MPAPTFDAHYEYGLLRDLWQRLRDQLDAVTGEATPGQLTRAIDTLSASVSPLYPARRDEDLHAIRLTAARFHALDSGQRDAVAAVAVESTADSTFDLAALVDAVAPAIDQAIAACRAVPHLVAFDGADYIAAAAWTDHPRGGFDWRPIPPENTAALRAVLAGVRDAL